MAQESVKSTPRLIRPDQLMRALVEELGGTTEAARTLGLSDSFVSLLKSGQRGASRRSVQKISDATGLDRDWLMFGFRPEHDLDHEGLRAFVRDILDPSE